MLCIVGMKKFDTRLILKNSVESIKKLLCDAFNVEHLEIIDESAFHAQHTAMRNNSETLTHICVRIGAPELLGLSRFSQHLKIYGALQPAIDHGLHAIKIEVI